jgi:23S rRNA pseudouridine1911/1915/1917 synthase
VLVVARTDHAHQDLAAQFSKREVEKIYLALVQGKTLDQGSVSSPITRDPIHRTRMTARLGVGRKAITHFKTLERLDRFSYLQVRIGTGRTHQIRVHLASIGHPIVGDTLYGASRIVEALPPLGRFFLHAASLQFRSPSSGRNIVVESALAPELANWLDLARVHKSGPTKHNRGS